MKYLVMECHPSFAVVLDEEGRFLKVANMRYEVGQTVPNVVEMQLPQTVAVKNTKKRWIGSLAAMAACLMLVVTSVFQQMPYASVYMAINPEVRIDVNRKDVVVGLEGVNADGEDLIRGYQYKKKDLNLVMDELVDSAIDKGYLHEGGKVTLTLDAENDQWIVSHSDALTEQLNQYLSEKITVTIEITNQTPQTPQTPTQHTVTIPVFPGDSDYGAEDYGTVEPTTPAKDDAPNLNSTPVVTDSPYEDGQTDYGLDDESLGTDGQSNYEDNSPDDDGQSAYDEPDQNDGHSAYDVPIHDDGQSAYHTPDQGDGQSMYGNGSDDDGHSAYNTPNDDDGQSEYEPPDDDDEESDEDD